MSDLTPPLTAGGQADTRFSLGLNVTRFYEEAPGGAAAGGFRLRFAVTNTNASAVRIGSLGIPVLSNSNFGGLNLSQVRLRCLVGEKPGEGPPVAPVPWL